MTTLLVPRRPLAPTLAWRDFDRLFDELWQGVSGSVGAPAPTACAPRIDVTETDDAFRVAAELPGLDEKDIEVSLEDGVLTLSGERTAEDEGEQAGYRHRETFRGSFRRALRIRSEVDADAVTAVYRNGILTVTLPKAPAARVRTIPVTGGSA